MPNVRSSIAKSVVEKGEHHLDFGSQLIADVAGDRCDGAIVLDIQNGGFVTHRVAGDARLV
jgi:hypothetical protein